MSAPTPSKLDYGQTLQGAFDDATGSFRVDAKLTSTIIATPGLEVVIQASDDNIAIRNSNDNSELLINSDGSINANSIKTPLTASSPLSASIGTTSVVAVALNANRKGLILINNSSNHISLGIGTTAVLNSGIILYPGGSFEMDEYSFSTEAIYAIAGDISSNLAIQEFTT